AEDLFSCSSTFFRMELKSVKIPVLEGRRILCAVFGFRNGSSTQGRVVAVYHIDERPFGDALKNGRFEVVDLVPANLWDFHPIRKLENLPLENAQSSGISFLGMLTHQLHSQANSQHWLAELGNELVQSAVLQFCH